MVISEAKWIPILFGLKKIKCRCDLQNEFIVSPLRSSRSSKSISDIREWMCLTRCVWGGVPPTQTRGKVRSPRRLSPPWTKGTVTAAWSSWTRGHWAKVPASYCCPVLRPFWVWIAGPLGFTLAPWASALPCTVISLVLSGMHAHYPASHWPARGLSGQPW